MSIRSKKQSQIEPMLSVNTLSQIKIMAKLELCNLYGLNVLRFSRDKKAKKKSLWLLAAWFLVLLMLIFYMGSLSLGLITLNLQEVVPAYLIAISGILVFFFGILKAGSTMFCRENYDILCAMPLSGSALVIGRMIKMYVEYLLATLAVLLPGIAVYGWMIRPGWSFYAAVLSSIWSVPLIPMAAAILIGGLVTGISSRMRHKSLVAAGLSIIAVLVIFFGSYRLSALEEDLSPEIFREMSELVFQLLGKIYPPAVWLGKAIVNGNLFNCLLCAGFSLLVFMAAAFFLSVSFHKICRRLFSGFARHNYRIESLKKTSVLSSLCKREFKRYFSSSIYVINTVIGPIMGCVLPIMLLASGPEALDGILPFPLPINSLMPFLIGGIFSVMTTTCTSISMEGKQWWIVKSLPLSSKQILDAKLLMNLLLILPFYLVSELLLFLALKPGIQDLLWLFIIPALVILFSCVYGITVNLHFPVLDWENEVSVVKQSTSALLGGMGGLLLALLCAIAAMLIPKEYMEILKIGICVFFLLITVFLYRKNSHFNIDSIKI